MTRPTERHATQLLNRLRGAMAAAVLAVSALPMAACSTAPVTHSEAAPLTDATMGLAVRQARVLQTLRPMAGEDALLPQEQRARAALARLSEATAGPGAGRARGGGAGGTVSGSGVGSGGGSGFGTDGLPGLDP